MADQDIKIQITSTADNTGFSSATTAASELKTEAGRTANAAGELGEEAKKSGEKLRLFAGHGKTLHKVIHGISEISPELGMAVRLALNPIGGTIIAATGLFVAFKKSIADTNEELDKVATRNALPINAGVEGITKAWADARTKLGEYYAALESAGKDKDPVATEIKRIKELADAMLDAKTKIIEAQGKAEVEYLKTHGGTAGQIEASEERTRSRVEAVSAEKLRADGSGSLEKELELRKNQQRNLEEEVLRSSAALRRAETKKANDDAAYETAKSNLDAKSDLNKDLEKARAKLKATPEKFYGEGEFANDAPVDNPFFKEMQNRVAGLEAQVKSYQTVKEKYENSGVQRTYEFETASKRATAATGASDGNVSRIEELRGELPHRRKVEAETEYGEQASDLLKSHGKNHRQSLNDLLIATGKNHDQQAAIIKQIINKHLSLEATLKALESQMIQGFQQTHRVN